MPGLQPKAFGSPQYTPIRRSECASDHGRFVVLRGFWSYAVRFGLFFLYLALPALLVVKEVAQNFGLSWAISLGLMAVFICSIPRVGAIASAALAALVTVYVVFNTALTISFITQGTSFNAAFLAHLDSSTLSIALQTDLLRMLLAVLYVLAAPVVVLAVLRMAPPHPERSVPWRRGVQMTILPLCLLLNYPLQSIALYFYTTYTSSVRLEEEIARLKGQKQAGPVAAENAKNIILIYLEGVEKNFHEHDLFPELMPHLKAEKEKAIAFDNIQQFPGTGWTIGGIVSSQCGVPLLSEGHGNRILAAADNPFRHVTCLAEFLRDASYRTVFMGGATLRFAGKGRFLRDNGFDVALGIDELPNSSSHVWGMYDSDLFGHAQAMYDGLVKAREPFLLTILTLDTHMPIGTPSPDCQGFGQADQPMLDAVHCADQLLGRFLSHVRRHPAEGDTIIVLVSDHLMMHARRMGLLRLEDKPRRLTFLVLDTGRAPVHIDKPGTHFDVGPTILDLAGVKNANFAFGHSLVSHPEGKAFTQKLSRDDLAKFRIENLVDAIQLEDGVSFDSLAGEVHVGGNRFSTDDPNKQRAKKEKIFSKSSDDFIAMYFKSPDADFPEIFWTPQEVLDEVSERSEGVLLIASGDPEICLPDMACQSGRYLMLRSLNTQQTILQSGSDRMLITGAEIAKLLE